MVLFFVEGILNQLDLYSLTTLSGLVKLADFPTKGNAVLDNCFTNKPELFQTPFPRQALIKTDHVGVILPLGKKLRPVRRKHAFRDFREHRKIKFESMIQTCDWLLVLNAQDVDSAINTLNESLLSLMNKCFPIRSVTLSSRDSPWMTPLVKYLLKKKLRANASGNVARAKELSKRVSELIAENRVNWGRAETIGSMQWWRRVHNISQRKNKPQPVLSESFLCGLNEFFATLCQDDSYTKSSFQEIGSDKHRSPRLNETEVMMALSKIKKTASGPDSIPCWV